jgi:predicted RNase H-like nuclease (RuvC/YqgF family)
MIGSKVFAIGDNSEAEALSAGSYTMENGNKMTIGDSSEILDLGEEKEAEDVEASEESTEKELAEEADVADWEGMEKRIKNLEDAVADLKADKVEASAELSEEVSEEKTEESEEDKTEMSAEVISELMTEVEELKSKITELSSEPATEGINYNPEGENFSSTVDLRKLSTKKRAAYYINNK